MAWCCMLHLLNRIVMKNIFTIILLVLLAACGNDKTTDSNTADAATVKPPATISYNIVASYPHDTSSYTQGLIWQNNGFIEGTGLEGQSRLMKVELKNGKVDQSVSLAPDIFGEGVTLLNNKIYQLTWQNHKVFVYDPASLKKIQEFSWEHDGWGLTNNGTDLIISTGESNIYFVDPATFKIKRTISVTDNNGPVGNLNELEYVNGYIFANIYLTDFIIKIDPATGTITGKMDLSDLLTKSGKSVDINQGYVLNGIAYDSAKNSLFITGKKWPLLFEMKLN